jgi:hypothetical protein
LVVGEAQLLMENENEIRRYLCEEIFPQLSPPPYGKIDIRCLVHGKPVYLFTEHKHHLLAVGKSFQHGQIPLEEAWRSANHEFVNLKTARERFGMQGDSCEMVYPFGEKKELSALLVTQKASGHLLDHYIFQAIYENKSQKLFQKLGRLAKFFAKLHQNSSTDTPVSPQQAQSYFEKITKTLRPGPLRSADVHYLEKLVAPWWSKRVVCGEDREVTVHGDATPTNFFIHHQKVTGIDLEKMRNGDRCWDLGFMAAELKHHFFWRMGDKWAAEPFIGHFLWEYAAALGNIASFNTITAKLPLYMALGLLRMVRNEWLDINYRTELIREAGLCLKFGL